MTTTYSIYNNTTEEILNENIFIDYITKLKNTPINKIKEILNNKMSILTKKIKEFDNKLNDQNIDTKSIKKIILQNVMKNKTNILNDIKTKNVKQFKIDIINTATSIQKDVRDIFTFDKNTPINLVISFWLFVFVAFINTFILIVLGGIIGPYAGLIILVSFIGPIIEEVSKYVAIKGKFGSEYLVTFNIMEFMTYFGRLISSGIPILVALIIRLIVVGMHYTTAFIQQKKQEEGREFIGLFFGTLMHSLWNSLAIFLETIS